MLSRETVAEQTRALVAGETATLPAAPLEEIAKKAADYGRASIADSSQRAYATDWRDFTAWCAGRRLAALPAEPTTIGLYLTEQADRYAVSTLQRRLASIGRNHRLAGHHLDTRHPAVRDVFAGIKRTKGTAQQKKAALMPPALRAMLDALPGTLAGKRDRALILTGFAAALRRSELVALDVPDLAFEIDGSGVAVTIRRSKTDQEGEGTTVGIIAGEGERSCPVRALRAWLDAAGITDGTVFRSISKSGRVGERLSDKAVALIVKRAALAAGLDPTNFAGHSLRSGFATTASANGADLTPIMEQTRHRSERVARGYVQRGAIFRNRAVAALRL